MALIQKNGTEEKDPPVVEEGTDDFGSDRVELQVRDVVEVLLAGFPEGEAPGEGGEKEADVRQHVPRAVFFIPSRHCENSPQTSLERATPSCLLH